MQDRSSFTTGDGTRIAYRIDGSPGHPPLVLSNSIGTSLAMWDTIVAPLTDHFRVVRYDTRGHGGSDAPSGAYSLDRLGADVLELLDALAIDRAHFCGLSLGGFIGQWFGVRAPERLDRLILANTSPYLGPAPRWDAQIAGVLGATDLIEVAETFLRNWFPENLRADESIVGPFRRDLLDLGPRGLAGCLAAVRDADLRRTNALIANPTLVITGADDEVCLPSHGEEIAATIPDARLVELPVVHLANVERPAEFVELVTDFLNPRTSGQRPPRSARIP